MGKNQFLGEEAELWDKFRGGDEEAFSNIYVAFSDVLYNYGCRLHDDTELVKDCLQDLFVGLWNKHQSLGPTTSIKFYLFRSLRRQIVLKVKEQGRANDGVPTFETEYSPEERLITEEEEVSLHHLLEQALLHLSERQREAIYLRFYQNMEFSDIGAILEISPRAVYKLIYRAIDVLQSKFNVCSKSTASPLAFSLQNQELAFDALVSFMVLSGTTFML